jgi:outer membrane autotransporter protein
MGNLAGLALINQGIDLAAGQGLAASVRAARQASLTTGYGLGIFGTVSGGWARYYTGSEIDMNSVSLMTGLAWGADLDPGFLTVGAFFVYGSGSYDTFNSFINAEPVHGNGDVYQIGGGIAGRMNFTDIGPGRVYTEASFRAGRVRNEFNSPDLIDALGNSARFESSSAYYGFHVGGGYVWNISDVSSLDLYSKYFWSRQKGDSVRLSTGDPVVFDDADSSRLRLGWRFTTDINDHISPYIGAAYEHDFDGQADATTNGFAIDPPTLRGNSGIGEVGLSLKPSNTLPLTIEIAAKGHVGKRKGVSGNFMMMIEF